jgi:hypothetical protein
MTQSQSNAAIEYPELGSANGSRSWAEEFGGDDVLIGLATDPPARNSRPLGQRVVQDLQRARREAQRERDQDILREAVVVDGKARAYERVMAAEHAGHPSSPADLAKAAHHAIEAGIVDPPSSIARLMRQAQHQRRAS